MADVAAEVIQLIAAKGKIKPSDVQPSDRLQDVGVDSLSAVELIFDLEEKFDIQIPYNANDTLAEFQTVGDVVNAIQKLVGRT